MKELNLIEIEEISGGKPKFLTFIGGAVFGAITGFFTGGPPGILVGAFMGASGALIKEGSFALTETLHPELGVSN